MLKTLKNKLFRKRKRGSEYTGYVPHHSKPAVNLDLDIANLFWPKTR